MQWDKIVYKGGDDGDNSDEMMPTLLLSPPLPGPSGKPPSPSLTCTPGCSDWLSTWLGMTWNVIAQIIYLDNQVTRSWHWTILLERRSQYGKRCLPAYKFYLPIGFLISFAVFFLGRIRYEQSRTLYLQCQSQSIETEFLEWLSLIQLFICVCWLLPQGENHQATVA